MHANCIQAKDSPLDAPRSNPRIGQQKRIFKMFASPGYRPILWISKLFSCAGSASNDTKAQMSREENMSEATVKALENGEKPLEADHLVPNAKDVSTYPGNEEGSVQPTTVTTPSQAERETAERERMRLEEERKHHEQAGS